MRNRFKLDNELFPELNQFEAAIVSTMMRGGDEGMPGIDIAREIEKAEEREKPIRAGRFYEALDRLANSLSLIERAGEEPGPNGTTRKFWRVNALGVRTLEANRWWWAEQMSVAVPDMPVALAWVVDS